MGCRTWGHTIEQIPFLFEYISVTFELYLQNERPTSASDGRTMILYIASLLEESCSPNAPRNHCSGNVLGLVNSVFCVCQGNVVDLGWRGHDGFLHLPLSFRCFSAAKATKLFQEMTELRVSVRRLMVFRQNDGGNYRLSWGLAQNITAMHESAVL